MKLRGKDIVVDLYFLFLTNEWDMKGYGKKGVMMMLWFVKMKKDHNTPWKGEIDEVGGGYKIMGEQVP